jgi:hydrogenase maturation protein HypF
MYANTAGAAPDSPHAVETVEIRVRGTVQGVGFRPTVWRLARENALTGHVLNDSAGVLIRATGSEERISHFLHDLKTKPPPLSRIDSLEVRNLPQIQAFDGFTITESVAGETHTSVTADAAICAACREEMLDPKERRFGYAFTNCTHCGPRLSIVKRVPYDRANTTMAPFKMCADCAREYGDPADRRFHAQPIACPVCGPKLSATIEETVEQLRGGAIVAIRGLGGFHLSCDATNVESVRMLRSRKKRFGKPFALMARDIEVIRRYAAVSDAELALLTSPAAPIVLLDARGERLPQEIAPKLKTLGFMLPYTPLHLLIVREFDTPLVMTSGNIAHEPQVTGNDEVETKLGAIADHVLLHDRDIANRIDDSVVRIAAGRPRLIRRARGYAPAPMLLPRGFEDAPEILAFGGELKSTFCLVKDGQAIVSQHQGDLEDAATFDDYQKNMALYRDLYHHRPRALAADLHPEYLSTKLAKERASGNVLHEVQHHHAHIASCMAENGLPLDSPPVLGVVLDGLGYGSDGAIWGGEFLSADYRGFTRLAHLKPVAMIGGAQAIREPWRNTYAHLVSAFGREEFEARYGDLPLCAYLKSKPLASVDRMLEGGLNVPAASSCGRLFDAVAAALGLCPDYALFEGQAAMELEDAIEATEQGYDFDLREPRGLWEALLRDLRAGVCVPVIASRFHYGLASAVTNLVVELARGDTVVLSGGCFQNKTLLEACTQKIENRGLRCLSQADIATNDGGLSLGQAAIAAARELKGPTPCA